MPKNITAEGAGKKTPHGLLGRQRPKEVREKISRALKGRPKMYPSYLKGLKGALHPSYKHGLGERNRDYDSKKQAAWIQGVKRQSNFKCFVTEEYTTLECHHLIGWAHEPTRYLVENGVALSKRIHSQFHNEYGRGDNTPEQFERFCREHYQITTFPWRQGNHKPSFSLAEEMAKRVESINTKEKEFEALVKERQHEIVEGSYIKNSSLFKIRCKIHGKEFEREAGLYKRAKLGLRCCSSARQSLSSPTGCAAALAAKRALLAAKRERSQDHSRPEDVNL